MFARYLCVDDLQAPNAQMQVIDPSLNDIQNAILALDGEKVVMVIIARSAPPAKHEMFGSPALGIGGGGSNGHYVCVLYIIDAGLEFAMVDPCKETGCDAAVMYGQLTQWPLTCCFSRKTVMETAKEFALNGKISRKWHWVDQDGSPAPDSLFC